jgi:RND family efflux transporter MFP subunit
MNRFVKGIWMSLLLAGLSSVSLAAELEGEVRWADLVTLSTNLKGEVVRADAQPGGLIKKGSLLVQIEDRVLRARKAQAQAELVHQELLLAEAKSELERTEELYDRTLLADHDLVLARVAHASANSSYQRAKAELANAKRLLELSRTHAPFESVVVARHVVAGETVNGTFTSVPLYTLASAEHRLVRMKGDAGQLSGLRTGDALEMQIGSRRYQGKVSSIQPVDVNKGDEAVVDIRFTPGASHMPHIGAVARVTLP